MSDGAAKAGLRIIALIEATKGALVLAAGLGLFALAHRNLQLIAEELVRHFHLNPAREFPRIFVHLAANLNNQKLWLLATGAILYALMRFVVAYGLWRDWRWMKCFAVISGAIYIPVEVHGVFHHPSWAKFAVLGINTLVVVYLSIHTVRQSRRQTGSVSKPHHYAQPSDANASWSSSG